MRSVTPSPFRPAKPVDQTILKENRKLVESIERRAFLRGTLSLGALTMLTGCDVTNKDATQSVLRAMSAWNDRVRPNFTFGAVSGITIITRFSNFMPAKAMPEAKLPEEWAATGRFPMRSRFCDIQFSAPNSLNEPTGVHP